MHVIDAFATLTTAAMARMFQEEAVLNNVASRFGTEDNFAALTPERLIELMDAGGVDQALLTAGLLPSTTSPWASDDPDGDPPSELIAVCEAHPDRFRASLVVDSFPGIGRICRRIEDLADHPMVVALRIVPFQVQEPIDSRLLYPIYERCEALGLPITINVGIPGPKVRGRCQDPMALDDVLLDFPDLVVVGAHMGHPWESVLISLMMKYENLHLMNSAYLAKYMEPTLVSFMRSSIGRSKVLFATDFPIIPFDRAVDEARKLPLDEDAMASFLGGNAQRVLGWTT